MTASKVIGIIPARYGSTRFPGKPLIPILGKTLLQRTYENALKATILHELIVATDDKRIFDHVHEFGGQAILTSSHCATGTDRLAEVLALRTDYLEAAAIVNIQGDEPCLDPSAINQAVDILLKDPDAHMSTVVADLKTQAEMQCSSIVKCVTDQKGNALYFSRSLIPGHKSGMPQALPYLRHIGLYVYRPRFLMTYQQLPPTPLQMAEDLEQLKVLEHGYRIKVAVTNCTSIGVDHPEDIYKVEQWLCKQNISLLPGASAPL